MITRTSPSASAAPGALQPHVEVTPDSAERMLIALAVPEIQYGIALGVMRSDAEGDAERAAAPPRRVPRRHRRYAGMSVPEKICQASADLATRLSTM